MPAHLDSMLMRMMAGEMRLYCDTLQSVISANKSDTTAIKGALNKVHDRFHDLQEATDKAGN